MPGSNYSFASFICVLSIESLCHSFYSVVFCNEGQILYVCASFHSFMMTVFVLLKSLVEARLCSVVSVNVKFYNTKGLNSLTLGTL